MNISDICTLGVRSCRPDDGLATAADIMWHHDFGSVPVVDAEEKLVGVVTDRDVCIAMATRRRQAADLPIGEVMSGQVVSCRLEDPVREALQLMRESRLRRLPVVDAQGRLKGIVSVKDIVRAARAMNATPAREALFGEIALTLMAISQHRTPSSIELADPRAMVPGV